MKRKKKMKKNERKGRRKKKREKDTHTKKKGQEGKKEKDTKKKGKSKILSCRSGKIPAVVGKQAVNELLCGEILKPRQSQAAIAMQMLMVF